MKIAIISDSHDNLPNLEKVLSYCTENKIEKLIHCGDLAEIQTLDLIVENFAGDIFWTFGNMDFGHSEQYPTNGKHSSVKMFSKHGEIEIANKKIAFVHYPTYAQKLASSGRFNYVFYGHTHKPWTEQISSDDGDNIRTCEMLNPGNIANQYYPPTFAVYDSISEKFSLIRINELK